MDQSSNFPYIHGFSPEEQNRLRTQALFGEYAIYKEINFSKVKKVLEIGCGTGAQTEILLRRFPDLKLTSIDMSDKQLTEAQRLLGNNPRVNFLKMDAQNIQLEEKFDGAFICWMLEHVPSPEKVLASALKSLRQDGVIYITEVMNFSFFLDPYSPNIWKFWMAFNDYQYENAGDPFIGAKLGNLLQKVGFKDIQTRVTTWHFDNRSPEQRKETILFWKELMLSGADQLLKENVISEEVIENSKKEFDNVANDSNAVFYYSFMQAEARA